MSCKRSDVFYSGYPIQRNSVIDGKFTAGEESYIKAIIVEGAGLAEKICTEKIFKEAA
jgi:hypothetical protein